VTSASADAGAVARTRIDPRGPFSLAAARDFLGGFTPGRGTFGQTDDALLLAFPVDGSDASAALAIRELADGHLELEVHGVADPQVVTRQAARVFSLDHDGTGFPEVGVRDPIIGRIQERYAFLRPVCFYSPYEAAVGAIVGQRISQRQSAAIRARVAREHGVLFTIGGIELAAFPTPAVLASLDSVPGLSAEKVERLHAVAAAALEGRLAADHLRVLPAAEALAELRTIRGIGAWSAQHVLLRGAGLPDELPTEDRLSREAVRVAYGLEESPGDERFSDIAEAWRPFRMWVMVLLRVWLGRERSGAAR
jgi:DNA-3-methyladenine glycosylase II